MRLGFALVIFTLALALAAPAAEAQTPVNPVRGQFNDSYYVAGRIIDGTGSPVAGGTLRVEVVQRGVNAEFLAQTNCFGDFIFTFNIAHIDPTGKVRVTLQGASGGVPDVTKEVRLDPFFRRSDLAMTAEGAWASECPDQSPLWPGRVSVTGRIVNRTETYEHEGAQIHAKPHAGRIRILYHDETTGEFHCPPSQAGADMCDLTLLDERGDFRYSFTFPTPNAARGRMEIFVDGVSHNATVDPTTRIAVFHVDVSGAGPGSVNATSAPSLVITFATIAALAVTRNVLNRDRR